MKANGLVHWAAAALLAAPTTAIAEDSFQLTSFMDEAESVVATDEMVQCDLVGRRRCRQPFFFAGTEMTFMQLDSRSGGQITASFSDTTAPGEATVSFLDGNGADNFAYAPRVWLGRQFGEKWGVVTRFWNLETADDHFPTYAPGTTPTGSNFATFEAKDRARLYTFDVEGTRSGELGKWKIDGTAGGRYASIGVESELYSFGVFTTGNFVNLMLQNGFSFDGAGVTGSLAGRRQLGESPFSIFLSVRGSYLGGHTDSFGRSAGTIVDNPNTPLSGAATVTRNNAESEMDIVEFQAGTQWDFPLRRLPVNAFFRAAVEYQMWDIDGPPTGGAGFGGTIGELTTNSFASAGLGGANMVGLALGCGFTW
jgi:hypothetical protein